MHPITGYLVVFAGAGLGGTLRHAVNRVVVPASAFPWSTLTVNVTGSLAIGVLAGWFALRGEASQTARLFLFTGILGGYTTFSAFSIEAALLWQRGQAWGAAGYACASVVASIAAVFLGMGIARSL